MIFQNEKQILNIIKFSPPIFIITIMTVILSILFIENNRTFNHEKQKIEIQYEKKNKELIKERVNNVYKYIKREQNSTEKELKRSLNNMLENAHTVMSTIYRKNKDKSKAEIQKMILDTLRNVRFNNGRGYFFIYDKKGRVVMLPPSPQYEGKDFIQHQDAKGSYIIQDMLKLLNSQNKTFYEWYWYKPNDYLIQQRKIGLVKNFEPLNWFIGTGEYIEDFEKEVQEKVLTNVREIRFGKSGYIFVINYDSIYLSHIRKNFIGQHATSNNDAKGISKVIADLIDISKKGDGYYAYIQNLKPGIDLPIKKVSYVKGLNEWSWVIGTGYYQDDLETIINEKKTELDDKFNSYVKNTISTALILTFILLLISIYLSKKLQLKFEKYKEEIGEHLHNNSKQQSVMAQQSKMAAMGEMIGNIAHQWRQPLSTITTTATGMQLQKEIGLLDDKQLEEGLIGINKSAQYLSSTIDDFRNFFKVDKDKVSFSIDTVLTKAITLVSVQLHNRDITLVRDIENVTIFTYENELIQVIINLLNNARDELIKKDNGTKKLIFIHTKKEGEHLIIEIIDNAGGVPKDIIHRLFEPYFTTKHKQQGTGIGLYMSQEIVVKNMNGNITVKNLTFTHEKEEYTGACFKISLPLTPQPSTKKK